MKVIDIPVGAEGEIDVEFSGGSFVLKATENTPGLQGAVNITIPVTYFVDALVQKLGGTPSELAIAQLLDSVLKGLA